MIHFGFDVKAVQETKVAYAKSIAYLYKGALPTEANSFLAAEDSVGKNEDPWNSPNCIGAMELTTAPSSDVTTCKFIKLNSSKLNFTKGWKLWEDGNYYCIPDRIFTEDFTPQPHYHCLHIDRFQDFFAPVKWPGKKPVIIQEFDVEKTFDNVMINSVIGGDISVKNEATGLWEVVYTVTTPNTVITFDVPITGKAFKWEQTSYPSNASFQQLKFGCVTEQVQDAGAAFEITHVQIVSAAQQLPSNFVWNLPGDNIPAILMTVGKIGDLEPFILNETVGVKGMDLNFTNCELKWGVLGNGVI